MAKILLGRAGEMSQEEYKENLVKISKKVLLKKEGQSQTEMYSVQELRNILQKQEGKTNG